MGVEINGLTKLNGQSLETTLRIRNRICQTWRLCHAPQALRSQSICHEPEMGEFAAEWQGFSITKNFSTEIPGRLMDRRSFLKTLALSALSASETELLAREPKSPASKSNSVRLDSDGMLVVMGSGSLSLDFTRCPTRRNHGKKPGKRVSTSFTYHPRAPTSRRRANMDSTAGHRWARFAAQPRRSRRTHSQSGDGLQGEPALLFWETEDEPTFVWKKPKREFRPLTSSKPITSSKTLIPLIRCI